MDHAVTEVRFWQIVMENERRTVICNPDHESRFKGYVAARGLAGLITVKPSPFCPTNRLFVVDEGAVEAEQNRVLSKPLARYDVPWATPRPWPPASPA